ncbi:hypothetical protein ABT369_11785 [Dactylosporangium sp. NPDC000244]|uniref:hypothetical protein n=1 Tax=Dactylosporangium sp. NPDC000244 TaxID=3154365 RepID=UPI0033219E0A
MNWPPPQQPGPPQANWPLEQDTVRLPPQAPPPHHPGPPHHHPGPPPQPIPVVPSMPPQPQPPMSGPPAYGPPQPAWTNQPVSSAPVSSQPVSSQPISSQPVSVQPPQAEPPLAPWQQQGTPFQQGPPFSPAPPIQAAPWEREAGPAGEEKQPWKLPPEGSAPSSGSRLWLGVLIGVLAGLLIFAPTGWYVGGQLFGSAAKDGPGPVAPSASAQPGLGVYESTQLRLNKTLFNGEMATMAEPWLPYISRCTKAGGEGGGAKLPQNEQLRITCQLGNMQVFFVEFKSAADREAELTTRKQQNGDAAQLAPGAAAPGQKTGTAGKNTGDYVEFAFKPAAAGSSSYAGIWWDRQGSDVLAARIEVAWVSGAEEKWDSLRDVWQRYS